MTDPADSKAKFRAEISKYEPEIDLAYTALLMAQYLSKPLKIAFYKLALDAMARIVQPRIMQATSREAIVAILNEYLFTELKFTGNADQYYHPHNSFLDKVIDLRRGIPISLSLIYLELGWRLNLHLYGINMPGHFIVGYGPVENPLYIDVFNDGALLSEDDCLRLSQIPFSERKSFREDFLKPTTKTAILFRMLNNLKRVYVGLEHWDKAYKTVDLMLEIHPDLLDERRDRGFIAYRLNRYHDAMADLRHYLHRQPNGPDSDWMKKQLSAIETEFLRLN